MISKMAQTATAIGVLSALLPCAAFAASRVSVTQTWTPIDIADAANDRTTANMPNSRPRVGDHLHYTVVAMNDERTALPIVAVEALPRGQQLVATSIAPTAQVSADAGATWWRASLHRVPASKVNAIRWMTRTPVAAGAHATFAYDTVVVQD